MCVAVCPLFTPRIHSSVSQTINAPGFFKQSLTTTDLGSLFFLNEEVAEMAEICF